MAPRPPAVNRAGRVGPAMRAGVYYEDAHPAETAAVPVSAKVQDLAMSGHPVTLELPDGVYDQIRRAAERAQRPLDDLLVEAIAAVAPVADSAPDGLKSALAQLAYLNDAALWQAARATLSEGQRARLQDLHDQKQRRPLSDQERVEEEALLRLYRETVLVRAQAAVLLKHRGYDVGNPDQFAPLG